MAQKSSTVILLLALFGVLWLLQTPAEAARQFSVTQVSPAAGFEISMGSTQTITFQVANNAGGTNAGERIYQVRFRLPGTGTVFSSATTAAPAGWTRTAWSTTSVTFQASSWAGALASGSSLNFGLVLVMRTTTADASERLRDVRASFTLDTNFGNGITRSGRVTVNTPGSWILKSLLMTLTPSSPSVGYGCQFYLTMTVTNRSSANGLVISPIPSPRPTANLAGGAGVNNPSPVPANLTLNAGVSSSMVWTYALTGPVGDTASFTACAGTGGSCTTVPGTSRTSSSVTSAPVSVAPGLSCVLTAALTNNPSCLFSGGTAAFQMMVTNSTGTAVQNVLASSLTRTGTAVIGVISGPSPSSIPNLANGATGTFTWTAPVTGNPNDTYYVTGYATANGPLQTATATSNIQDVDGYSVSAETTKADSTNAELTWTITNYGCANISQVVIAPPAGWTFADDGYALVTIGSGTQVDTWTRPPGAMTFTSTGAADRMPQTRSGDFSLLFSGTPAAAGTYTFTMTITDDSLPASVTQNIPVTVLVNPFDASPGGPNSTGTSVWHEDIR